MESDTQDRGTDPGFTHRTDRTGSEQETSLSLALSVLLLCLCENTQSLRLRPRPFWWLFRGTARETSTLLNLRREHEREWRTRVTLTRRLFLVAGRATRRSSFCSMFFVLYEMSCSRM